MNRTRIQRTPESFRIAHSLTEREFTKGWRTRFAPAPTGFLHLGHVVNALHVWGIAHAHRGQIVLRIEDHDRTRSRADFEQALLDDLDWLGFKPYIGATAEFREGRHSLRQSDNPERYAKYLNILARQGQEFGCICTRRDIAAVVGDVEGEESPYPGTCAHTNHTSATARRFRVTDSNESFHDLRLGEQIQNPKQQCGDFLVRDRNGNYTYQFCVAVDDFENEISLIVRGEDLLSSSARQMHLARSLGRAKPPQFLHHALLMRADGVKLSKSLGDTGVREMRCAGLSRESVLGRAAFACGLIERDVPLSVDDAAELFT